MNIISSFIYYLIILYTLYNSNNNLIDVNDNLIKLNKQYYNFNSIFKNTDFSLNKIGLDSIDILNLNELSINIYLSAINDSYNVVFNIKDNGLNLNNFRYDYYIKYDYILDNYELLFDKNILSLVLNLSDEPYLELELFNNLIVLYNESDGYFYNYIDKINYYDIYNPSYQPQFIDYNLYNLSKQDIYDYNYLKSCYYNSINELELLTYNQANHDAYLYFISIYINDYFNHRIKFNLFFSQFNDFKYNLDLDINYILNFLTVVNDLDDCDIIEIDKLITLISTYNFDIDNCFDNILISPYNKCNKYIYIKKSIEDSECIKYLINKGIISKDAFEGENRYFFAVESISDELLIELDSKSIINYKNNSYFNDLKESLLPSNEIFECALELSHKKLDKYIIDTRLFISLLESSKPISVVVYDVVSGLVLNIINLSII